MAESFPIVGDYTHPQPDGLIGRSTTDHTCLRLSGDLLPVWCGSARLIVGISQNREGTTA